MVGVGWMFGDKNLVCWGQAFAMLLVLLWATIWQQSPVSTEWIPLTIISLVFFSFVNWINLVDILISDFKMHFIPNMLPCMIFVICFTFFCFTFFFSDFTLKFETRASRMDLQFRYIDKKDRLSIYRHFWKMSISISISIWSYLKISISIRQYKKYWYRYWYRYGDFGKYRYRYR